MTTIVQQAGTAGSTTAGAHQDGDTPAGSLQLLQQQQHQDSMASSNGSVSNGSGVTLNCSDGSSSPLGSIRDMQVAGDAAITASGSVPPSVASLDVVVKAFETRK